MHEFHHSLDNLTFASLDLETTGLNPDIDQIIEVGIQIFTLNGTEETFSSLVKPCKKIPKLVTDLTGITQDELGESPSFEDIKPTVIRLLRNNIVIGHNINFDLKFLEEEGLLWDQEKIDTLDLAYFIDYDSPDYRLDTLISRHNIASRQTHRALDDCTRTMELFKILLEKLCNLSPLTLNRLHALSRKTNWNLQFLLQKLNQGDILSKNLDNSNDFTGSNQISQSVIQKEPIKINETESQISSPLEEIFGPHGHLSKTIDNFENRPDQLNMATQIYNATECRESLFIEAGTGTGKSLAYLVPILLSAKSSDSTTIVSTNTLNLQEQLLNDDLPMALECVGSISNDGQDLPRVSVLKGRSNYLCNRRLQNYLDRPNIGSADVLLLAKILVWKERTKTGDKSEISLTRSYHHNLWKKLSAEGAGNCDFADGCFLKTARERAANSNIIITNHSLLFANISSGGSILPEYDQIVIDEAHHLEEQATNAFGYEIKTSKVLDIYQEIMDRSGTLQISLHLLKNSIQSDRILESITSIELKLASLSSRGMETARNLVQLLRYIKDTSRGSLHRQEKSIDNLRTSPDWTNIELEAENLHAQLLELITLGNRLVSISDLESGHATIRNSKLELESWCGEVSDLREKIYECIFEPKNNAVYWVQFDNQGILVSLNMAPLDVSLTVREHFFTDNRSVIMTSATLRTSGNFEYIQKRLGGEEIPTEVIKSPFDYRSSTLCIEVEDTEDPRSENYLDNVSEAIAAAAVAAEGRTLALFTSHSAIQSTHQKITAILANTDIAVLSQGISGSPKTLIQRLRQNPKSVILGTSSMWEGVDVRGDALQVVAIARLPFEVPTNPIYQARSEQYTNPFMEYALPNAIIRFRQGFGRLIRSKSDRGIFLILDSRTVKTRYGGAFLKALPSMLSQRVRTVDIGGTVSGWLK